MNWRVDFAPQVQQDVAEAAQWYERQQAGLDDQFIEEIIRVWESLADNALLNSRRHPARNIRWRYADRFPYRVIYEVNEAERTVKVAAVLHAARQHTHWKKRL